MDTDQNNKNTCEVNGCSCSVEGASCNKEYTKEKNVNEIAAEATWWLEHSRRQTAKLWEMLDEHLDEATQSELLEQLGRNCASFGRADQYIGDPEGFFQFMYEQCGEVINYDRAAGVITVITRERDCDCRLVNSKHISPIYCNCSIGWQKQTYETILGRAVKVEVVEAVIRGSSRCVFQITVLEEEIRNNNLAK